MKLVFATNNRHKLEEISAIIGDKIEILGLNDIGCHDDIPETADTFEGNALLKARYVKDKYGYDCFADDTGLQVEALNGEPGVYSARYAGEPSDSEKNIDKLLEKKKQKKHDFLYWEFDETDQIAVRMDDWKMVVKKGTPFLYNLKTDIHEDTDIALQHPDVVEKMKAIIFEQHTPNPYFSVTLPKQ